MKRIISVFTFVLIFSVFGFGQAENSSCPTIEVIGPDSAIHSGEIMFFSALLNGKTSNYKVEYEWSVDQGTIINGQGSSVIQVSTEGLRETVIDATVVIRGLPAQCSNKASDKGVVIGAVIGEPYDRYGKIPLHDELPRIDNLLIEMKLNPDYEGFILINAEKPERIPQIKKHIQRLVRHIKMRKTAIERITFAIEIAGYDSTFLILVPQGASIPECENCEIIRGEEVILK